MTYREIRLIGHLPDNRLGYRLARVACWLGWHSVYCRGRADHGRLLEPMHGGREGGRVGERAIRLLPALAPNCTDRGQPESEAVAHDWRDIGSDAVQQYDQCARCGRTEPWSDHPYRAELPEAGFDD